MRLVRTWAAATTVLVAASMTSVASPALGNTDNSAKVVDTPDNAVVVPHSYVVWLTDDAEGAGENAASRVADDARKLGAEVADVYDGIDAFSAKFNKKELNKILRNPDVASVQPDQVRTSQGAVIFAQDQGIPDGRLVGDDMTTYGAQVEAMNRNAIRRAWAWVMGLFGRGGNAELPPEALQIMNVPDGVGLMQHPTNGWQHPRPGNGSWLQQPGQFRGQQPGNGTWNQPGNGGMPRPGNGGWNQPGNGAMPRPGNGGWQPQPGGRMPQQPGNGRMPMPQRPGNGRQPMPQQPGNGRMPMPQQPGNGRQPMPPGGGQRPMPPGGRNPAPAPRPQPGNPGGGNPAPQPKPGNPGGGNPAPNPGNPGGGNPAPNPGGGGDDPGGTPWGVDRIDQRDLPLDKTFTPGGEGAGVHVYVVDTGLHASHSDFAGRVGEGYDAYDRDNDPADCNGHGTHVAGTAAGTTYGVAKKATIHGVRVLGCDGRGNTSSVVSGMDWVAKNAIKPAVANMSLGGGASTTDDAAVQKMVAAGITVVVAAGNESSDACGISPAREPSAITVASSSKNDGFSSFSNWGSCVDIVAPGDQITSAWYTSDSATNSASGTSMASPHVAGAAALYLSKNSSATPDQVASALTTSASSVQAAKGTPAKLLYTKFDGNDLAPAPGGGQPAPAPGGDTPAPAPGGDQPAPGGEPAGSPHCGQTKTKMQVGEDELVEAKELTTTKKAKIAGCVTLTNQDVDLDLYIQQQMEDGTWLTVGKSTEGGDEERAMVEGPAGKYRIVVKGFKSAGEFEFGYSVAETE